MSKRRLHPWIALAATVACALAVAAGTATAGGHGQATPCPATTTTQPFLPWLDLGSYFAAPGGTFESNLAGWTVSGGAKIVPGNESYFVDSHADRNSLSLPSGSKVTSPSICVSLTAPDIRLFVQNNGSLLSLLNVSVNYTDASGRARSLPLLPILGTPSWTPSLPILFLANVQSILSTNGQTWVSFTFSPAGVAGRWQVDDFYVDPIKHQ
jgi:hypothetical protein